MKHNIITIVLAALSAAGISGATIAQEGSGKASEPVPRWRTAPSVTCTTSSTPITLTSLAAARTAGLQFAQISVQPVTRTIERNAEVAYNANRYARLSSRAPGVVAEVLKDLGESVRQGDVIAVIDSIDLGAAKADLLQAAETLNLWQGIVERERELLAEGVGVRRQLIEAETKVAESRIQLSKSKQRLRNLGLTAEQIASVEKDGDTSSLLALRASFNGIVVERDAVIGEVVESSKPLLAIADTSVMWAMIDLTESDLSLVKPGQEVMLRIDGMSSEPFLGTLNWISTEVDHKTRTIKARAEFDNGLRLLRANMFGRAAIQAGGAREAVSVPKEAVHWEGCCNIAFIKADEQGLVYQPVRLTLGFDAGNSYEVLDGLKGGETIVTRGSFVLKNEILKSSVGAGCCEVGHLDK